MAVEVEGDGGWGGGRGVQANCREIVGGVSCLGFVWCHPYFSSDFTLFDCWWDSFCSVGRSLVCGHPK